MLSQYQTVSFVLVSFLCDRTRTEGSKVAPCGFAALYVESNMPVCIYYQAMSVVARYLVFLPHTISLTATTNQQL